MITKNMIYILLLGPIYAAASSTSIVELLPRPVEAVHRVIKMRVPQDSPSVAISSVQEVPLEIFYRNIDAGGMVLLQSDKAIRDQADAWYSSVTDDVCLQKLAQVVPESLEQHAHTLNEYGKEYISRFEPLIDAALGLALFDQIVAFVEKKRKNLELTTEQVKLFHAAQLCSAYCAQKQYSIALRYPFVLPDGEAFNIIARNGEAAIEGEQLRMRHLGRSFEMMQRLLTTQK